MVYSYLILGHYLIFFHLWSSHRSNGDTAGRLGEGSSSVLPINPTEGDCCLSFSDKKSAQRSLVVNQMLRRPYSATINNDIKVSCLCLLGSDINWPSWRAAAYHHILNFLIRNHKKKCLVNTALIFGNFHRFAKSRADNFVFIFSELQTKEYFD